MKSVPAGPPADRKDKKTPAAAKIGGELESLEDTMKGPLDALSEREALEANPFDDAGAAGLSLSPATPKKFKFRRFLKKLFRRNKSKIVRVKAADPRHVKLVLISWGVAIVFLIGLLTALYALSPRSSSELLQKAEEAMAVEDYNQAIGVYDEFLKHYSKASNASDVRLSKSLAELQLAEKKAIASGDWSPAFEIAKAQVKTMPKDYTDSDIMQRFSIALAKIGEGLAQTAQGHPDKESVDRLQSVIDMLETDIPERNRPARMIEEIRGILKPCKQQVEGRRQLDQTVDAIRSFAKTSDVAAAYAAYREIIQLYPELSDDARLADAMKLVSALQQEAVKPTQQSLAAVRVERPSGVLAAMPLAVHPVKGELAAGRGKPFFVVEQGTAYGLNAATGKALWRRFVALDPKLSAVTSLPITGPAGSDVVLCDPVHQELLRVRGATG
ncbi:MAG: hypothetical protein ABSG53_10675, partial [Thermoguttaceae bacterium]